MEEQQQQQQQPRPVIPENDDDIMMDGGDDGDQQEAMMDNAPLFLNPEDAVEVQVDDNDVPMDDDDDDDDEDDIENVAVENERMQETTSTSAPRREPSVVDDMSNVTLASHTGHVYAVGSFYDATTRQLFLVSGGGDDKAYLHHLISSGQAAQQQQQAQPPPKTLPLEHAHTDSVSCVALNLPYLLSSSQDTKKFPRMLAVGGYDGAIVLYNPDDGSKLQVLEGPTDVECLAWHGKGGSVLLAGSAADGTLWMYHVPLQKCLQVFVGHERAVTSCAFSPDGKWALSCSSDGTVRQWAPRTGLCKHTYRVVVHNSDAAGGQHDGSGQDAPPGLTCMATNGGSDGQLIVVGSEDGQAHVCHIGSKKVVVSLRHYELPATTGMDDAAEEDVEEEDLPMSVEAVGFASAAVNPNWCATGGVDGVLKIWDLANNAQCRQVCQQPAGITSGNTGESAAPETTTATATTSSSNSKSSNKPGGITRLQWHPSLPVVFTADTVGTIRIWDARKGRLLQSLTGHADVINDMSVSFIKSQGDSSNKPEEAVIVSASDDKTVKVFHVDVAALLQQQDPATTTTAAAVAAVPVAAVAP